jgi:mRNA-degrading endonuclease RelE of RelBE toxin-antitoxin system
LSTATSFSIGKAWLERTGRWGRVEKDYGKERDFPSPFPNIMVKVKGFSYAPLDAKEDSGYSLARMKYEIVFAPEAVRDVRGLRAHLRSMVRDGIETSLRHVPTAVSKSRIKRLRGLARPQFRLRLGEVRVYSDVKESTVEILAIVPKSEAAEWLKREGRSI